MISIGKKDISRKYPPPLNMPVLYLISGDCQDSFATDLILGEAIINAILDRPCSKR